MSLDKYINQVICGDCLEVMKELPDKCIDIVITSPPYNFGRGINTNKKGSKYLEYNDNLSQQEYFEFIQKTLDCLLRITKKYIFFNFQLLSNNKSAYFKIIGEYKDKIKDVIIWDKMTSEPAIQRGVLNSQFEIILIIADDGADKRRFYDVDFHGTIPNVFKIGKVNKNQNAELNRATFPDEIPEKIIINFSKESDIILDPFNGTGTTTFVSQKNHRNFIGIDLCKSQCEYARERLKQKPLF